jgi:CheY-like chemotaxis protein
MNDDLFCLKVLIVSDAAQDREALRRAAAQCSAPAEIAEVAKVRAASVCERLQDDAFDVVFLDSMVPNPAREEILSAVRLAKSKPLTILLGPAETSAGASPTDGVTADRILARPIDDADAKLLLEACARARQKCRLLVVDDSSTVRSVIRKVALASRYRLDVAEAADGSAAIDLTGRERFDILFLDCHMPGVHGFAALETIRRANPGAKAVMMTALRDPRIEDHARQVGAADFLYKPFFAKDIDAVLARLFGLTRPRWG